MQDDAEHGVGLVHAGVPWLPEEVAQQDRFREVVDLVAVLPVDPDVFDADVPRVADLPHDVEDAAVVDDVLLERRLEPARAGRTRAWKWLAWAIRGSTSASGTPARVKWV